MCVYRACGTEYRLCGTIAFKISLLFFYHIYIALTKNMHVCSKLMLNCIEMRLCYNNCKGI